ncbi:MAG: metallophosphoesterase family protein [Bacteroidales bacterium]
MTSRRSFVKRGMAAGAGLALFPSLMSCKADPLFRFALCADVHKDIMPDADKRLMTFMNVADSYGVNFVAQLGDFCYPEEQNREFLNIWKGFAGGKYSVLGMHDMDKSTKQDVVDYLAMPDTRYSFDVGGFTFIVLDTNFYRDASGEFHDYANRNFMMHDRLNQIPDIQIEWLRAKLESSNNRCIIFSHYPLFNVQEQEVNSNVRKVLESENERAGYKKVVASFNGYTHADYSQVVNSISYVNINSMSHLWVGAKYSCDRRFTQIDNKNYPPLKYTMPYTLPLYAVVEVYADKLKLIGTRAEFMKPTPQEMDMHSREDGFSTRAFISDLEIVV